MVGFPHPRDKREAERTQTYRERLGVDAILDHRDADGQRPTVKMAVLNNGTRKVKEKC